MIKGKEKKQGEYPAGDVVRKNAFIKIETSGAPRLTGDENEEIVNIDEIIDKVEDVGDLKIEEESKRKSQEELRLEKNIDEIWKKAEKNWTTKPEDRTKRGLIR